MGLALNLLALTLTPIILILTPLILTPLILWLSYFLIIKTGGLLNSPFFSRIDQINNVIPNKTINCIIDKQIAHIMNMHIANIPKSIFR